MNLLVNFFLFMSSLIVLLILSFKLSEFRMKHDSGDKCSSFKLISVNGQHNPGSIFLDIV